MVLAIESYKTFFVEFHPADSDTEKKLRTKLMYEFIRKEFT
jgi:hypothetical protein